jgi:peroxiredoxin
LADYREHYAQIRATGADVTAISVDLPRKSEALRRELRLPFPILSDSERRVIREWDIYNPREKGGIAKPALFVINRDRTVRYSKVDTVATRVPAAEVLRILGSAVGVPVRPSVYIPHPADFLRAIRNKHRH